MNFLAYRYYLPDKLLRVVALAFLISTNVSAQLAWPAATYEQKPWSRWWWMGSAVNKKDLTALMEQYQKAGLGGLEITPIYGVKGYEDQFIEFLSPKWMEMLEHTLQEAKRLNMGIDMAQASGWPFGGPWVTDEDACKYIACQTYTVKGGESLKDSVQYIQKPIVRAVGHTVKMTELVEPVYKNKNLQALALDQVRFEKPLPLQALMAYSDKGDALNLTDKVGANGQLNWKAPAGNWTLYALFQGWHGKMVERAGPGGEGNVIDHFSGTATKNYLQQFDKAFQSHNLTGLRAFFNDSYEVDDAQGEANWTPLFLQEFQNRRGYDLRQYLPALFGKDSEEQNQRVRSDYRETLGELLLEKYSMEWHTWAKDHGRINRNQAHGSPANILDLYAVSDIPEIEGVDILRIKFASSAAHVMGKKLTSSESATWLNEHFLSSLGDVKQALDLFMLGGVNHIFYHGTNYSPANESWPGWLFYAAVHFHPSNPFWKDFSTLNTYVTRCQSFLQDGKSDNDVLVYFPIYDMYAEAGKRTVQHFDGLGAEFNGTTLKADAQLMVDRGYSYDFISDRQIANLSSSANLLQTGNVAYQTLLIPEAQHMPIATLEKLIELARNGATIAIHNKLPVDVPGLGNLSQRQKALKDLLQQLSFKTTESTGLQIAKVGKGMILLGDHLDQLLTAAHVRRETITDAGLQYIRRKIGDRMVYFVANRTRKPFAGWTTLQSPAQSAGIYNPMTGKLGLATLRKTTPTSIEVYLQLAPGESCLLEEYANLVSGKSYDYYQPAGSAKPLAGEWKIHFVEGGPSLPKDIKTTTLKSWTELPAEGVKAFSGTATYSISFAKPDGKADGYLLSLDSVYTHARIEVNGQPVGTLLGPSYEIVIPATLLKAQNQLQISVTNLMANRIADKDQKGERWQKFYNINVSARRKENVGTDGVFTAAHWQPQKSGIVGQVSLTPVQLTIPK
ncbi:glycosyl hydrolase [Cytophagaceae bacterium DM2B3-1]|uniref:Glycosyl hydrolase n=1 Tax=Xanthocytophaga flava TaxID=3048013 RepID=A0ABT7CTG4_9BACT|nr:glycosyl hydrolase [Xanthocytophaga flavus]MDJ1497039.1 glycosyl hydrolase [Xanthocytophaga flavus]